MSSAETTVPKHVHQWAVTDWLAYADTEREFLNETDFRPSVYNVSRHRALTATCLECGETKRL